VTTAATLAKREAIAAELATDDTRSNRQIAALLGVSKSTVASVRAEMATTAQPPPAPVVAPPPEPVPAPEASESQAQRQPCPCCYHQQAQPGVILCERCGWPTARATYP
jgi:hypothetical protein